MSEQISAAEEKAAVQTDPGLSRKKRMALIVYLAILFIVALIIVTLSLVIQIHGNTEQYSTISEKANALQAKNEALQEEKDKLKDENAALLSEVDGLQNENTALAQENETLKNDYDTLQKQSEDTAKAFDLLLKARDAYDAQDEEAFRAAMDELAPLSQYLSSQAQEVYNELLDSMATHTPEP